MTKIKDMTPTQLKRVVREAYQLIPPDEQYDIYDSLRDKLVPLSKQAEIAKGMSLHYSGVYKDLKERIENDKG